jgi:hypothetical protein
MPTSSYSSSTTWQSNRLLDLVKHKLKLYSVFIKEKYVNRVASGVHIIQYSMKTIKLLRKLKDQLYFVLVKVMIIK